MRTTLIPTNRIFQPMIRLTISSLGQLSTKTSSDFFRIIRSSTTQMSLLKTIGNIQLILNVTSVLSVPQESQEKERYLEQLIPGILQLQLYLGLTGTCCIICLITSDILNSSLTRKRLTTTANEPLTVQASICYLITCQIF